MRPRHGEWLPDRAEIEEIIREHDAWEEAWMLKTELGLFMLCAMRFMPGSGEPRLRNGMAIAPSGRLFGRRAQSRHG
jgi:hypothetical protein